MAVLLTGEASKGSPFLGWLVLIIFAVILIGPTIKRFYLLRNDQYTTGNSQFSFLSENGSGEPRPDAMIKQVRAQNHKRDEKLRQTKIEFDDGFTYIVSYKAWDYRFPEMFRQRSLFSDETDPYSEKFICAIEKHAELCGKPRSYETISFSEKIEGDAGVSDEQKAARFVLEHTAIPSRLQKNRIQFIIDLHNGAFLYNVFSDVCLDQGVKNPYTPAQFRYRFERVQERIFVGKFYFPTPEKEGLSYLAYFFYKSDTNLMSYYLLEMTASGELPELISIDLFDQKLVRRSMGVFDYEDHREFMKLEAARIDSPEFEDAVSHLKDSQQVGMWTCPKCGVMNYRAVKTCHCGEECKEEVVPQGEVKQEQVEK